jgi:hypothetical protein
MNLQNPFHILRAEWGAALSVEDILSRNLRCLTVSGENAIHARGFFTDFAQALASLGDSTWWLVDLEGGEHFVEFSASDTEEDYFEKLKSAPEWAPGQPFPYAVRYQGFVGRGDWLFLSDRDGERMHMIFRDAVPSEQLAHVLKLIWN